MSVVRPEFGPTLPELLGPRLRALPRWARLTLGAAAAFVVLGLGWALLGHRGSRDHHVIVREPLAFNFIYRTPFATQSLRDGELSRVGSGEQSFRVRPLSLSPYRGDSSGTLPVLASRLAAEMAREYDGFAVREEGRANINKFQGYELVFQARRNGRLVYGRRIMLLPTVTSREGVDLLLEAPRTAAIPRADAIGRSGGLKTALRSFRFGTDRP